MPEKDLPNCLFIGNGLNRTLPNSLPWEDLLKSIADSRGVTYNEDNPMPIEFERILNVFLDEQYIQNPKYETYKEYTKAKCQIADLLENAFPPEFAIHKRLFDFKHTTINAIITTNYDYMIERAFDNKYKFKKRLNYDKYIFSETANLDRISIYHAHGLIDSPKSICLGNDHYRAITSLLQRDIAEKINNKQCQAKPSPKTIKIRELLLGHYFNPGNEHYWGQRFFTSNLAIVGFGLSQNESDIWWLITYRAYLYYANIYNMRNIIRNTIVYYMTIDVVGREFDKENPTACLTKEEKNKINLLESEHIVVKLCFLQTPIKKDDFTVDEKKAYERASKKAYKQAYQTVFDDIDQYGICNNRHKNIIAF